MNQEVYDMEIKNEKVHSLASISLKDDHYIGLVRPDDFQISNYIYGEYKENESISLYIDGTLDSVYNYVETTDEDKAKYLKTYPEYVCGDNKIVLKRKNNLEKEIDTYYYIENYFNKELSINEDLSRKYNNFVDGLESVKTR